MSSHGNAKAFTKIAEFDEFPIKPLYIDFVTATGSNSEGTEAAAVKIRNNRAIEQLHLLLINRLVLVIKEKTRYYPVYGNGNVEKC